ncbi:tubulin delta chain [Silurus meridionalis]|nr:tubulin delta chain [Silurus meridionalis]
MQLVKTAAFTENTITLISTLQVERSKGGYKQSQQALDRVRTADWSSMSAVVLQVGQCGNQLGLDWWKLITQKSKQHKKRFFFHPSNIIEGKGGRGGNWAYGYHGERGETENALLQKTMEAVRREAERQDYYGGTVLLHSLSGGTGSGFGSRLCEDIREEFPVGHILTMSVVPHQSGESPLQHYNTLLSLAALHRSTDGILLFHNDHVLSQAGFQQKSHAGFGAVSCGFPQSTLSAMNAHITSCMAGLLMPLRSLTTGSGQGLGIEPWELVRSVCPVPTAKLLYTAQASASETTHWDTLVSETLRNLPQFSPDGKPYSSRAVLAVARGNQDNTFILSNVLQKLQQGHRCVPWNPFPVDHWTDPRNEAKVSLSTRTLTVCSNHSSVTRLLGHVVQRTTEMLSARAYLHWYERYGIGMEEFQQALNTISGLIEEYESQ